MPTLFLCQNKRFSTYRCEFQIFYYCHHFRWTVDHHYHCCLSLRCWLPPHKSTVSVGREERQWAVGGENFRSMTATVGVASEAVMAVIGPSVMMLMACLYKPYPIQFVVKRHCDGGGSWCRRRPAFEQRWWVCRRNSKNRRNWLLAVLLTWTEAWFVTGGHRVNHNGNSVRHQCVEREGGAGNGFTLKKFIKAKQSTRPLLLKGEISWLKYLPLFSAPNFSTL